MHAVDPVTFSDLAEGVRLVEVNNPPVNALSGAVRSGLLEAVKGAEIAAGVRAVVIACASRTFIAGADIREFGKPDLPPSLPEVLGIIERSAKPVVAALHGSALGGGLEVALACHARVALEGAMLGLPEVNLGLMPGAGGTQRLPRIVGLQRAMDMILSGKPVKASLGRTIGLVDELVTVPESLRPAAVRYALGLADRGAWPIAGALEFKSDASVDFDAEIKRVEERQRGLPAPPSIVRVLRDSVGLPFDQGLRLERAAYLALRATSESAALRHVFFAERARIGGGKPPAKSMERVAVVGAGTMGQGIAISLAEAGLPVMLLEPDESARERARAAMARHVEAQQTRGQEPAKRAALVSELVRLTDAPADVADSDLVIEAVFEDLDTKCKVFRQLESLVAADAILASNTSYLDLDKIAASLDRPNRFLGLHFFSPANLMRLLEVVRASATAENTLEYGLALGKRLGKVAVPMGNCYGFTGNRMLAQRTREAYFLLEEGAMPWDVDRVLQAFGFPMGPFGVGDLAGLDIGWRNRQARLERLTERERACTLLDQMVERGWLGQKSGRGFYVYDASRKATPSPEVEELILDHSRRVGMQRRAITGQEILERCLYPMVNEAASIIDEQIVERAEDVDLVWLHGYGFPRFRGGPLYWADQVGLGKIAEALDRFGENLGRQYWQPARGLRERALRGQGFFGGPGT